MIRRIARKVKNRLFPPPQPKARRWTHTAAQLPWTDQPDALEQLGRRVADGRIPAHLAAPARQFIDEGYCVLEQAIAHDVIDRLNEQVDELWTTDTPRHGVVFNDAWVREGELQHILKHEDLIQLPQAERDAINRRGKWRAHGLHFHLPPAREIFDAPAVADAVSALLGVKTGPLYSINFQWGSKHIPHQDLMVFHVHPPNYLIGAWLALEDISPDCGPLFYMPGSHREPIWEGYPNYPQTNLRTSDHETRLRYEAHLVEVARKYERKVFLAKKGDVLLWHAMLLHGGADIVRPELTRRSFVVHYIPEGYDQQNVVVGPFMW